MDERARYSAKERKAYYMGVGSAIGQFKVIGLFMPTLPKNEKDSFLNGWEYAVTKKLKGIKKNKKGR